MIRVVPFRAIHAELLFARGVQASQVSVGANSGAVLASLPGCALTVFGEDDRILMCGGVVPFAPWLGVLWGLLSWDAGGRMVELHYATRRFIGAQRYRRIEATVPQGFPAGCRWLELLRFRPEGVREAYGENGEDHMAYALVRRT